MRASPSTFVQGSNFTLSWNPVSGATHYQLYATAPGSSFRALNTTTSTSSNRSAGRLGTYIYYVAACDNSGCGSRASTTVTTTSSAPPPPVPGRPSSFSASPSTFVQGSSFTLSWGAASGATSYNLYARPPGGSERFLASFTGRSSTRSAGILGTYTYRVQGCNSSGCGSSRSVNVTTTPRAPGVPPTPSVAASATLDSSYTISWGAASGTVTAYQLYENNAQIYSGTSRSRSRSHSSVGNRSYKVRACNGSSCSGFSGTDTINIVAPTIGTPGLPSVTGGAYHPVNTSYTISWPAATGAANSYELYENETLIYSGTSRSRTFNYSNYGQRRYRVKACYRAGVCGALSAQRNVVVYTQPGRTNNLTASSTTLVQGGNVTLNWTTAGGNIPFGSGARYDVRETQPGGTEVKISDVAGFTHTVSNLSKVGTYRYRVRLCNPDVPCGSFATVNVAVTPSTPGVPPTPSVAPSAVLDASYTVSWGAASGTVTAYQLYEGNTRIYSGTSRSRSLSQSTVGNRSYKVRACNVSVCSGFSGIDTINIVAPEIGTPGVPGVTGGAYHPVNTQYTVTWSAATNATIYKLYEVNERQNTEAEVYSGPLRSFSVQHSEYGRRLYRVKACYRDNICGSLSPNRAMVVYTQPGRTNNLTASATTLTQGDNVTLNWTAAGGNIPFGAGARYEVHETQPGGTERKIDDVAGLTHAVSNLSKTGTYRYRVRLCNPDVPCGSFASLNVTVDPPAPGKVVNISGPSQAAAGSSVTLTWTAVTGSVDSYKLYRDSVEQQSTANTSITVTVPNTAATYEYQVKACNAGGCGPDSNTKSILVYDTPTVARNFISTPSTITAGEDITLSWLAPTNAIDGTYYRLFAESPTVADRELEIEPSLLSSIRSPGQVGTYTYGVRACSPDAGCSPRVNVEVTVNAPDIGTPATPGVVGGAYHPVGTAYTVNWPAATNANIYKLYELEDRTDIETEVYSGPDRTFVTQHSEFGRRRYRVKACYSEGVCGESSPQRLVFVYTQSGPVQNLTASSTTITAGDSVTLSWGAAGGTIPATEYEIHAQRPTETQVSLLTTIPDTSSIRTLGQIGEYRFRVRACNPDVACGSFRDITITVNPEVPSASTVNINVLDESPLGAELTLSWSIATGDIEHYELVAEDISEPLYSGPETTFSYIPPEGVVSYRVRACNIGGCSEFSPVKNVTVYGIPGALNFGAISTTIKQGDTLELTWDTPTSAVSTTQYNLYAKRPAPFDTEPERVFLNIDSSAARRVPGVIGRYTYYLEACNEGQGCNPRESVDITVLDPEQPNNFIVSADHINVGQTVTFTWEQAAATNCAIRRGTSPDEEPLLDNQQGSGTESVRILTPGTFELRLECVDASGAAIEISTFNLQVDKLGAAQLATDVIEAQR
ncbi:hypothetical protein EYS14_14355 [Alteromonadaceae bacterium M269]|nr:hypothetical protein EYS14_14355 [Alteromonadaceae bacterium M269]